MTDQTTTPATDAIRPRRDPATGAPRIAESDKPDPRELDAIRERLKRRRPIWWK